MSTENETPAAVLRDLLGTERSRQAELARALGVRPPTITKWLNEQTGIPVRRWASIELALGAAPMTFANRTGIAERFRLSQVDMPTDDGYRAAWEHFFPERYSLPVSGPTGVGPARAPAAPDDEAVLNQLVVEVAGLRQDVRDLARLVEALNDERGAERGRRAGAAQGPKRLAK